MILQISAHTIHLMLVYYLYITYVRHGTEECENVWLGTVLFTSIHTCSGVILQIKPSLTQAGITTWYIMAYLWTSTVSKATFVHIWVSTKNRHMNLCMYSTYILMVCNVRAYIKSTCMYAQSTQYIGSYVQGCAYSIVVCCVGDFKG